MITVSYSNPQISGLTKEEAERLSEFDPIRQIELASIRRFVEKHQGLLCGRILDYGAGKPGTCRKPQPYRDLCRGISYEPFEKGDPEPQGEFDTILCTQVLNYVGPVHALEQFNGWLKSGGHLVCTYTANWDLVDSNDMWRLTPIGMKYLIERHTAFEILEHEERARVQLGNFAFRLGYGIVCRKK